MALALPAGGGRARAPRGGRHPSPSTSTQLWSSLAGGPAAADQTARGGPWLSPACPLTQPIWAAQGVWRGLVASSPAVCDLCGLALVPHSQKCPGPRGRVRDFPDTCPTSMLLAHWGRGVCTVASVPHTPDTGSSRGSAYWSLTPVPSRPRGERGAGGPWASWDLSARGVRTPCRAPRQEPSA